MLSRQCDFAGDTATTGRGGGGGGVEEHKRRANCNKPFSPSEAACDVLQYLIFSNRNMIAKAEKGEKKHAKWKACVEPLIKRERNNHYCCYYPGLKCILL